VDVDIWIVCYVWNIYHMVSVYLLSLDKGIFSYFLLLYSYMYKQLALWNSISRRTRPEELCINSADKKPAVN
jgi:hypothetical protein